MGAWKSTSRKEKDVAAYVFWDAVHTLRNNYRGYNDLIIRGSRDGAKSNEIIVSPGDGSDGKGTKGGDVVITPDPYLERSRQS